MLYELSGRRSMSRKGGCRERQIIYGLDHIPHQMQVSGIRKLPTGELIGRVKLAGMIEVIHVTGRKWRRRDGAPPGSRHG